MTGKSWKSMELQMQEPWIQWLNYFAHYDITLASSFFSAELWFARESIFISICVPKQACVNLQQFNYAATTQLMKTSQWFWRHKLTVEGKRQVECERTKHVKSWSECVELVETGCMTDWGHWLFSESSCEKWEFSDEPIIMTYCSTSTQPTQP